MSLIAFLLLSGSPIVWPEECRNMGDLYYMAAKIRDAGKSRELVLKAIPNNDRRIRLAIEHVYDRKDMSAGDWRWLAVGVCVGQRAKGSGV